jgi:hypothetical protein
MPTDDGFVFMDGMANKWKHHTQRSWPVPYHLAIHIPGQSNWSPSLVNIAAMPLWRQNEIGLPLLAGRVQRSMIFKIKS